MGFASEMALTLQLFSFDNVQDMQQNALQTHRAKIAKDRHNHCTVNSRLGPLWGNQTEIQTAMALTENLQGATCSFLGKAGCC